MQIIYSQNPVYLNSTEAICAKIKYYWRRWEKLCKLGCAHPDQPLTSRVCWLQSKLLRRFKTGEKLPRDVLRYLTGYRLVGCVLLGRSYF